MSNILDSLPLELNRERIIDSRESARFVAMSLQHFRRLQRAGKIAPAVRIGDRKLGYRIGDLIDLIRKSTA
jgi:hypothetical protein